MGFYTTSKTTKKRDKCISKMQAEIAALKSAKSDLLAALENMVAWNGKRGGDADALLPADQQDKEVAQAMRVIAKAKGETK